MKWRFEYGSGEIDDRYERDLPEGCEVDGRPSKVRLPHIPTSVQDRSYKFSLMFRHHRANNSHHANFDLATPRSQTYINAHCVSS